MKKLLLIITIFYFSKSNGQSQFILKSSEDDSGIKYANIYSQNVLISSTDSLGNFKINDKFLNSNIKITALGYKTLDSVALKRNSIFYMEVEAIILNEIIVDNKKKEIKKYKLGKVKNGNVGLVCTLENNTISQVAKYFQNKNETTTFLEKIRFKTLCTDKNRVLSIFIYSVGANGEPDKILNKEAIICNLKKGHNTYEVNLNQFYIDFPVNGVFIALNYIFIEQNKCYRNKSKTWYFYEPSIDANEIDSYEDTWYNLNGVWKKASTYNISMELTLTN